MQFQENFPLKDLNTLAVDSVAEVFCQVQTLEDVKAAIEFAKARNLPIKVLGGGSNVVMAERVSGLVVQHVATGFSVLDEDADHVTLSVKAGQNWHELVMQTLEQGFSGLENLAYIPGSVGAAPVQNIGAYGVEAKDLIVNVHGVNLESAESFTLSNSECEFEYRESIFKHALVQKVLITDVEFKLNKHEKVLVKYAPLNTMAKAFQEQHGSMVTAKTLAQWVIDVRKSKLPEPSELPNAGSFFKNPVVELSAFAQLKGAYPEMPYYEQPHGIKLAAGWLIDQLGLKGKSIGPVKVHHKQALVLVNQGGSGADINAASSKIKQMVLSEYGVELEQEPRPFS